MNKLFIICTVIAYTFYGCSNPQNKKDRLGKAARENKNGWIYVHLEGSPADIGYQHGYLLSNEIDTTLHMLAYFLDTLGMLSYAC